MSKSKTREPKKASADKVPGSDGGWRETIESIAMAVILALLFRGFVAEAFVIPTGSMAPTLQGRHKDVQCPKCFHWYQTSASDERNREDQLSRRHVTATTCPICRYTQTLDLFDKPNHHSFSGDRIIVGKFCYDLTAPERWDVIVFKYPGNAVQNYIKRLIGLPNERVRIAGGNIYTRGLDESDDAYRIARKPPHKLGALLQLVHDTNFIPAELTKIGWPTRWQADGSPGESAAAWQTDNGGKSFTIKGADDRDAWLRYRHLIPSHDDWTEIELQGKLPAGVLDREGQLITDFYAYNAGHSISQYLRTEPTSYLIPGTYDPAEYNPDSPGPGPPPVPSDLGQHWVDDVAMEVLAEVTSNQGELLLDLFRAGIHHECRIDLATGKATLRRIGPDGELKEFFDDDDGTTATEATATTSVKGSGSYRLRMSNCDHEVLLWVNGRVVKFDGPTTYFSDELVAPAWSPVDPGDLAPAGIGSRGAAVKVSDLRIYRDKYYTATTGGDNNDYVAQVRIGGDYVSDEASAIQQIFADPELWETSNLFDDQQRRYVSFALEEDQFLPLGDNSPQSSDGRYWGPPNFEKKHHYVERDLLIGKALLIYWPHTWNRPIPFQPNFSQMGRIR